MPAAAFVPIWLLVLVTLSGTMAMHIFVPALPLAGIELLASASNMQQTITVYVVGLALGQLLYGPIADSYGRRPVLLLGLGLYLCASVLAFFATTLEFLMAARLLQALGGGAGIILGRTIVRDMSAPDQVTRKLALLNLLTLVGPGVAPILGGYLADNFGWRSVYLFLILLALTMNVCVWRLLPETLPNRTPLAVPTILKGYGTLLSDRRYLGFMIAGACSSTAVYPYLASAPYIVHEQLALPVSMIGWFAAFTILGASLGTLFTRYVAEKLPNPVILYGGIGIGLSMALALTAVQLLGWLNGPLLAIVTIVMTFGAGMASPVALSRSLAAVPMISGAAAGMYGFGQMAIGALGTLAVGFGKDHVLACSLTQICLTAVALGCCALAYSAGKKTDA
ncbi:Bcr/CflA family efflux MFS transporter [Pseudomonas putida]